MSESEHLSSDFPAKRNHTGVGSLALCSTENQGEDAVGYLDGRSWGKGVGKITLSLRIHSGVVKEAEQLL